MFFRNGRNVFGYWKIIFDELRRVTWNLTSSESCHSNTNKKKLFFHVLTSTLQEFTLCIPIEISKLVCKFNVWLYFCSKTFVFLKKKLLKRNLQKKKKINNTAKHKSNTKKQTKNKKQKHWVACFVFILFICGNLFLIFMFLCFCLCVFVFVFFFCVYFIFHYIFVFHCLQDN